MPSAQGPKLLELALEIAAVLTGPVEAIGLDPEEAREEPIPAELVEVPPLV